jgi:acetoin utilization deacetylase AcuC-like enzyme
MTRPGLLIFEVAHRNEQRDSIRTARGTLTPSNEVAERTARIRAGILRAAGPRVSRADIPQGTARVLRSLLPLAHDPAYLAFLNHGPHPVDAAITPQGQTFAGPGVEQDTPVAADSADRALASASVAVAAAAALGRGEADHVYALCRPPGHHAGRRFFGGYCFLNNAALAALTLRRQSRARVAVIDIDYHAGNGTTDCLAAHPDIAVLSCHASGEDVFPHQDDPLPAHPAHVFHAFGEPPDAQAYLAVVSRLVGEAIAGGAETLVMSLGYDVIAGDPHGGWSLSPDVFAGVGEILRQSGLPVCVVQEGGYLLSALEACAAQFTKGLIGPPTDAAPDTRESGTDDGRHAKPAGALS